MKKLLFIFALLPILLIAQQPFGYNATWIFEYDEAGIRGVDSLYHEKDTLYLGETWQYLNRAKGNNQNMFVQTVNDTVYYLVDGQKLILYDFNATIGDSWNFAKIDTNLGCPDQPRATVSSVGFDTINGTPLQYRMVENPKDTFTYGGSPSYQNSAAFIMDKIYDPVGYWPGYLGFIAPTINFCNGIVLKTSSVYMYQLRCYHDDNIDINFTQNSCLTGIGVAENNLATVKIYPNPSNGFVFIETEKEIAQTEIYNITGQKLRVYKNEKTIELPQHSGFYFLHITFKNGAVMIEKVVKE